MYRHFWCWNSFPFFKKMVSQDTAEPRMLAVSTQKKKKKRLYLKTYWSCCNLFIYFPNSQPCVKDTHDFPCPLFEWFKMVVSVSMGKGRLLLLSVWRAEFLSNAVSPLSSSSFSSAIYFTCGLYKDPNVKAIKVEVGFFFSPPCELSKMWSFIDISRMCANEH